jgi:hypothetical protein
MHPVCCAITSLLCTGLGGGGEGEEGDDDSLKLAWEMLETARIILDRMKGRDAELQLAEVRSELGSVSLEQNLWDSAIAEFTEVVKLQVTHLPGSRMLAES